jgi:hypothetical protein
MLTNTAKAPTNPLRADPLFQTILDTANDIAKARGYQVTLTPGQCGLVLDAVWLINRTQAAKGVVNAKV